MCNIYECGHEKLLSDRHAYNGRSRCLSPATNAVFIPGVTNTAELGGGVGFYCDMCMIRVTIYGFFDVEYIDLATYFGESILDFEWEESYQLWGGA